MIDLSKYNHICTDSRQVREGDIFFAIQGFKQNGEDYIQDAIASGASLIVVDESSSRFDSGFLRVPNIRQFLASAVRAKYLIKAPKYICAVTGTNGKTSITNFYKQLINCLGKKAAMFGTTGVASDIDLKEFGTIPQATTLDVITFTKLLNYHAEHGIDYICIEASSHGLHQYRLDSVKFAGMGFTNLTPDHMEYHKDMDDYFAAKLRLFTDFSQSGSVAVICNQDSKYHDKIKSVFDGKVISYGIKGDIYYQLEADNMVTIFCGDESETFESQLYGEFQLANLCASIGLVMVSGFAFSEIAKHLGKMKNAVGRMQLVSPITSNTKIFVDYAHTPDALERVLIECKKLCKGKLFVVFGCGGDRFHEKRGMMGSIANRLADFVIVTDDNSRSEDPASIRAEIMAMCDHDKARSIGDRRKAILDAIAMSGEGDVILIAGKGHETYQEIRSRREHFSDIETVEEALKLNSQSYS